MFGYKNTALFKSGKIIKFGSDLCRTLQKTAVFVACLCAGGSFKFLKAQYHFFVVFFRLDNALYCGKNKERGKGLLNFFVLTGSEILRNNYRNTTADADNQ